MRKLLKLELKRLREDIKSCEIKEVKPLIQPMNKSLKGEEKEHLLSHLDVIEKLITNKPYLVELKDGSRQHKARGKTCEWEQQKKPRNYWSTTCGHWRSSIMAKHFNYCPYCGKPIKIK